MNFFRLKKCASAVASGSAEEVWPLVDGIDATSSQYLPFITPALYASPDPVEIPTILEWLDSSTPFVHFAAIRSVIARTLIALRGLSDLGFRKAIPVGAHVDLWLRTWPWIEFLDQYRDHLPGCDSILPAPTRYQLFVSLFRFFRENDEADKLIDSCVGSCAVVGRAWCILLDAEDGEGFSDVCHFIGLWFRQDEWRLDIFEELLTGVGGSRMALASLVVAHINRVHPTPDSAVTRKTVFNLVGVVFFVKKVSGEWDAAFRDALLAQGIVTALTIVSRVLSASTSSIPAVETELKGFFSSLVELLTCFPRQRWIKESLQAGLLPAVFSCAASRHLEVTYDSLDDLLRDILPASTVYYSVLSQLRVSLVDLGDRDARSAFGTSDLRELWDEFLTLVQLRLQVVDEYDMGSLTVLLACDNLECVKIGGKDLFKRCGGCCMSKYCSRACQIHDWQRGGHRQTCGALASRRNRDSHLSAKDRSFLRALLNNEYAARQEEIAMQKLHFMREYPTEVPYTIFNYTEGICDIDVGSHEDLDTEFAPDAARAAASSGRVQLHLIEILEGESIRSRAFRLYSASAGLTAGLRSIAASLPPCTSSDEHEVEDIVEQCRPQVQTLINLKVEVTH
ncbi:hypothetical protein B0H19DRAFT_1196718 [Mycena capillaripes]|nr:hypothetical protein B0H19DRAFT_1196718 [Mycena capillaripes]